MKAKKSANLLPYNTRNMEQVGIYQGSGKRGKVGTKKGTFTDSLAKPTKLKSRKSVPLKNN